MMHKNVITVLAIFLVLATACTPKSEEKEDALPTITDDNELVTLLQEFRQFRNVPLDNGVPD